MLFNSISQQSDGKDSEKNNGYAWIYLLLHEYLTPTAFDSQYAL